MGSVRIDPFKGFESVARRINSVMSDLEKGMTIESGGFNPRLDIIDTDKNIYINAEMAGIKKDDIVISVNEDNILTIKGKKVKAHINDDMTIVRTERAYGDFNRSFALPDNADTDNMNAKFENGILELTIAKNEPEKPKEIKINID